MKRLAALLVLALILLIPARADAFGTNITGCSVWQPWEDKIAVTIYNGTVTYSSAFLVIMTNGDRYTRYPLSIGVIDYGVYRVLISRPAIGHITPNYVYGPGVSAEAHCTS